MEVHRSMPEDIRDYAAELHCLQQLDDAVVHPWGIVPVDLVRREGDKIKECCAID